MKFTLYKVEMNLKPTERGKNKNRWLLVNGQEAGQPQTLRDSSTLQHGILGLPAPAFVMEHSCYGRFNCRLLRKLTKKNKK